jgi:hypothetical protein
VRCVGGSGYNIAVIEPRRDDFPNHFVGDLVETHHGWVVVPPTCCPGGHNYRDPGWSVSSVWCTCNDRHMSDSAQSCSTPKRIAGSRQRPNVGVRACFRRDAHPMCGRARLRGRRVRGRIHARRPVFQLRPNSGFVVRFRRGRGSPLLRSFAGVPRKAAQQVRCPAGGPVPDRGPRLSLSGRSAADWRPRQQCLRVDPCFR